MINTGEVSEEALEGVLVQVLNATCTEVPGGANFGKWKADDGSGFGWIGKEIYTTTPDPQLGQVFDVTGVISYSFGLFGIQPRDANDVNMATGLNEIKRFGYERIPESGEQHPYHGPRQLERSYRIQLDRCNWSFGAFRCCYKRP